MTAHTRKTIAILLHARSQRDDISRYVIAQLAQIWREEGHRVVFLCGTRQYVPADLCIVHVDLSRVPERYLSFAQRYPIALNAEVRDIRKSSFSKHLLRRHDAYEGKVIVKSNFNAGGCPEYSLLCNTPRFLMSRIGVRLRLRPMPFYLKTAYRIYDRLRDVPSTYFRHTDFIVEKFLPERDGEAFVVRTLQVLGDSVQCVRLTSPNPIVFGGTAVTCEVVKPHPEMLRQRSVQKLDYGKLDYCIHDGEAVLLDVNKTTGFGGFAATEELAAMHRERARGLYQYFDG